MEEPVEFTLTEMVCKGVVDVLSTTVVRVQIRPGPEPCNSPTTTVVARVAKLLLNSILRTKTGV